MVGSDPAAASTPLDTQKLNAFAGKAVGEISAAVSAALVVIGTGSDSIAHSRRAGRSPRTALPR